jgi:hypothetical protein
MMRTKAKTELAAAKSFGRLDAALPANLDPKL